MSCFGRRLGTPTMERLPMPYACSCLWERGGGGLGRVRLEEEGREFLPPFYDHPHSLPQPVPPSCCYWACSVPVPFCQSPIWEGEEDMPMPSSATFLAPLPIPATNMETYTYADDTCLPAALKCLPVTILLYYTPV